MRKARGHAGVRVVAVQVRPVQRAPDVEPLRLRWERKREEDARIGDKVRVEGRVF